MTARSWKFESSSGHQFKLQGYTLNLTETRESGFLRFCTPTIGTRPCGEGACCGARLCAGVPECNEGTDRHAAEHDRAQYVGNAVGAHTSNVEFAAAPYAALLILVSGLQVYLLTTRMYLSRRDRHREQARSHNWVRGTAAETGWLLGRLRGQARSHNWIGAWPESQVGY